jgi:hypothetical protein
VISEVPASQNSQFGDEVIQNFFIEIKSLVDSAFGVLDEEVKKYPGKSSKWRSEAMSNGLKFLGNRENEASIIDTVAHSDDACLSLTNLYFSAMNRFIRGQVSRRDLMSVNFIPFGKFIANLYSRLANDENMKGAFFTTMSYSDKDAFLADTLRRVMRESSSVKIPETDSSPPPSSVSVFSTPITPSDSVSNITKPADPAPRSVAPSVVMGKSVAAKALKAAIHNDGGGSHASRRPPSRFSSFKQASVVGDNPPTKIITLSKMDRHALPARTSTESRYSTRDSQA